MAQNLQRNINIGFRVTAREKELILKQMEKSKTPNLNAYLRKIAIDGFVINVNVDGVMELSKLLRSVSNNVNQITRRVNATNKVYIDDLQEIKARLDEIWKQQNIIIRDFANLVELGVAN